MSCGGLNAFIALNVPNLPGDGAAVTVSSLGRHKTVYLSGAFEGKYILFGSHDGTNFVPVLSFDSGELPPQNQDGFVPGEPQPTLKKNLPYTLHSIIVRRAADRTVNISVGGQETCACT